MGSNDADYETPNAEEREDVIDRIVEETTRLLDQSYCSALAVSQARSPGFRQIIRDYIEQAPPNFEFKRAVESSPFSLGYENLKAIHNLITEQYVQSAGAFFALQLVSAELAEAKDADFDIDVDEDSFDPFDPDQDEN